MRYVISCLVGLVCLTLVSFPASAQPDHDIVFQDVANSFQMSPLEYRKFITELAIAISPSILAPAETLGVHGFDFGLEVNNAFIHSSELYWQKATSSGTPPPWMYYPTLRVRKGFLFSTELESTIAHLPFSEQNIVSGGGRFGLHEGFELVPDLTFGVNYTWFFGNPHLRMGVFQWYVALGYTWPIGAVKKIKTARISPYIAYGQLYVDSQLLAVRQGNTLRQDITAPDVGFQQFAGLPGSGALRLTKRKDPRPDKWVLGVQAHSGRVSLLLSTTLVDRGIPTVNFRVGTTF